MGHCSPLAPGAVISLIASLASLVSSSPAAHGQVEPPTHGVPPGLREAAAERVAVGDVVDHEFVRGLVEGRGAGSLGDLRGSVVLLEFWGTS